MTKDNYNNDEQPKKEVVVIMKWDRTRKLTIKWEKEMYVLIRWEECKIPKKFYDEYIKKHEKAYNISVK